eukprot:COSAG01_NODE_534_length_15805_cov_9.468420_3_plen_30_part_00
MIFLSWPTSHAMFFPDMLALVMWSAATKL